MHGQNRARLRALPALVVAVTAAAMAATANGTPAQDTTAPPGAGALTGMDATPSCLAELDWAADYASRNYSGFETKTAGDRAIAYAALLDRLRAGAAQSTTPADCDALLGKWVAFFEDGHLSVRRSVEAAPGTGSAGQPTDEAIRDRFADWPRRDLTEPEARRRLASLGDGRSPIEGIWENADGAYRGVVLRDEDSGDRFTMSILRADSVWWVPGQVKAIFEPGDGDEYDVRFFMRDHSENAWTGHVRRNALVLDGSFVWFREWPAAPDDLPRDSIDNLLNLTFAARELEPGTILIQLPSFDRTQPMDSLFEAEGERIAAADRLLVDLRGNGGGSDYNYRHLIPLVYTDPIHIVSNEALATVDNIRVNEQLAADTTLADGIRTGLASSVEQMKTAEGGWYPFPDRTHEEEAVLERPRRVDVLVDGGCASSCEQFLLAARQSRKVTIYGQPTAGILDFGNVRGASMPGGALVLYHPTTRSKRLPHHPVDGVGVPPDVAIPTGEPDPVAWILRER